MSGPEDGELGTNQEGAPAADIDRSAETPVLGSGEDSSNLSENQPSNDFKVLYLSELGAKAERSTILRNLYAEVLQRGGELSEHVTDDEAAAAKVSAIRDILSNLIAESGETVVEVGDNPLITEVDEQSVQLVSEYLNFVESNKDSTSFRLARGLSVFRYGLNSIRTLGANRLEKLVSRDRTWHESGWLGRSVTLGATALGGFGFRQIFGAIPGLSGLGAGLSVQRLVYGRMMQRDLERDDLVTSYKDDYRSNLNNIRSSRGAKRSLWTRITSPIKERLSAHRITKAQRRVDAEYIYQLGTDALYNRDRLQNVERYTAVLQNSIDERIAANEKIGEDDPDYQALLAALQVLADTVAIDEKPEIVVTERSIGLRSQFNEVGYSRVMALKISALSGALVGMSVGALGSVFSARHAADKVTTDVPKPHTNGHVGAAATTGGIGAGHTSPVPAESPVVTSPTPVAPTEVLRPTESLTDQIHTATNKIFGITKENADSIDSAHAEHLVRAQILHDLNIGHVDPENGNNILFSAEDKEWLSAHNIVFNTEGNLDFSHASGVFDGKDVSAVITEHLHQWEQASDLTATTPTLPELTDVVRNMQFTQLDHELMLTVSRDYKMDLAELRELRWESGSDVSKLFADHKLAWQNLLKDHQLKVGDKLLQLEQAQGNSPMEKTRWIMRQWLESRKVAGLQINPDVTDTFAVEPELHWFFGTPIQPTVDQVVPTAHPVFGAAKSTIGQSQPLNLTYSMPNTAGTPDPFEAATRHSLPGLNPHHTPGVAGHNVDAGVSTNGLDQHPTTGSAPREALPTVSRVEVAKPNQLEMPKAKVNVMDADGQAAQAARATTAPLRPNMTSEVAKPDLAEPKSGLNPLSAPAAKVEHPNSLERILFGKSSPEASGQPLPAIADRVPATVEGPSIDADDTSKIPSLQESD